MSPGWSLGIDSMGGGIAWHCALSLRLAVANSDGGLVDVRCQQSHQQSHQQFAYDQY